MAADALAKKRTKRAVPILENFVQGGAVASTRARDQEHADRAVELTLGSVQQRVRVHVPDAESRGQHLAFEALARVEIQRRAIAIVQSRCRGPHQLGCLGRCKAIGRIVVGQVNVRNDRDRNGPASLRDSSEAHVSRDREEPWSQTFGIAQLINSLRGQDERVVHRIFGVAAIAKQHEAQSE